MNPMRVMLDHAAGGRWTSLHTGNREWLWLREDAAADRMAVRPGDEFVDAGGIEECVPTIRGRPDHGDAWCRPWRPAGDGRWAVDCPDFTLYRRVHQHGQEVVAEYELRSRPGYRFLWAAHALLDVTPTARLHAPVDTPTRLYADPVPPVAPDDWPVPHGVRLDALGPDDGTAVGAILLGCAAIRVVDGPDVLDLSIECEGQPVSVALWRNLRGWPPGQEYRSIGVEPMLGRVFDLAEAAASDAAVVPPSGRVRWRLLLTASP